MTKLIIGIRVITNLKSSIRIYCLSHPTPGGGLLRELKDREQELNRIVEKGGMKVEDIMVNKVVPPVLRKSMVIQKLHIIQPTLCTDGSARHANKTKIK